MTTKHTGGPAFPLPVADQECHGRFESGYGGISMRDWFAGLAMQGMLADGEHKEGGWKRVVDAAYAYADAMLDAREEE